MQSFALQNEMRETPDLLRTFDPAKILPWLPILRQKKKILLTGEGSSRIFPAHNVIAHALQCGADWTLMTAGAREALDYDLSDTAIIGVSNSGRTRELIALFTHAKENGIPCFAITATPDSTLTDLADDSYILMCGKEQAIAASKSVFEQALVFQSLLQGDEWQNKDQAASLCQTVLEQPAPADLITPLAKADCIYIAGRNDGVAEELVLKATEITRKRAIYLEGTYLLHGVEEVLQPNDVLILIEPFEQDWAKIQKVIIEGTGVPIIAIASAPTPFSTYIIPCLTGFDRYFQLLGGWQLLVAAALQNNIDLDVTRRARKSGNAV